VEDFPPQPHGQPSDLKTYHSLCLVVFWYLKLFLELLASVLISLSFSAIMDSKCGPSGLLKGLGVVHVSYQCTPTPFTNTIERIGEYAPNTSQQLVSPILTPHFRPLQIRRTVSVVSDKTHFSGRIITRHSGLINPTQEPSHGDSEPKRLTVRATDHIHLSNPTPLSYGDSDAKKPAA
jgi:hypothetical protein